MRRMRETTRTDWVRTIILSAMPVIAVGAIVAGPAKAVPPQTVKVNCDKGRTIASALEHASPGRPLVIVVSGDCVENVVIRRDDVTLVADTQSSASISPTGDSERPIIVEGQRVRIEGFASIHGGQDGILVRRGASADIVGNTIHDAVGAEGSRNGTGISVSGSSDAQIWNNTIRDNHRQGINILEGSNGDIFNNTIKDNGRYGIVISRTAAADIDGNEITGNGAIFNADGIGVFWNSHARLSNRGVANTIEGNDRNGVRCRSNSSVQFLLGQNFGSGNSGGDTSFGLDCAIGTP